MAYTRTNWIEEETPLSAQNMNNIEDGIEELQAQKVDKASGKGLSSNDYTSAEKTKLAGIETGADVNVQPDWEQTDTSADDYIKNKPGEATTSTAGLMSASDKSKLDGIEAGAQVNRTYTSVTGKPTEDKAPAFGGSVLVSQVLQNSSGQLTLKDRLIRIPSTLATTSNPGLMSAADKTKLNNITIRIATAVSQSTVTIGPHQKGGVSFKYKTAADHFSAEAIVVPMELPAFSSDLAISSYSHTGGYFVMNMTNSSPDTTRSVSAGKEVKLLVIDNEVS